MHPRPVYIQTNSNLNSSAASSVGVSPQQSVSSIHYLEPNEVEENLVECKSLINDINLNDAGDSDIEIVEID
uniref:Uncharacterized protein n=1 Tax=Panagrolaimus sp. ES5 TaxID=591445 RepID=A0AC34GVN5_9BILA